MNHDSEKRYLRVEHYDAVYLGSDDMESESDAVVTLLDVLEAFASGPPTPGNVGVMNALASTGACKLKKLKVISFAQNEGMLHGQEWTANGDRSHLALSDFGLQTLETSF